MKTGPESPRRKSAGTGALGCLALAAAAPVASGSYARQAPTLVAGQSTHQLTAWIRETGNNHGQLFAIIDKKAALLHVFDGVGKPLGSSPVLLGLAVGDDSVPGIGERKMSAILPAERTTPAGRFFRSPAAIFRARTLSGLTTMQPFSCTGSVPATRPTGAWSAWQRRLRSTIESPTAASMCLPRFTTLS